MSEILDGFEFGNTDPETRFLPGTSEGTLRSLIADARENLKQTCYIVLRGEAYPIQPEDPEARIDDVINQVRHAIDDADFTLNPSPDKDIRIVGSEEAAAQDRLEFIDRFFDKHPASSFTSFADFRNTALDEEVKLDPAFYIDFIRRLPISLAHYHQHQLIRPLLECGYMDVCDAAETYLREAGWAKEDVQNIFSMRRRMQAQGAQYFYTQTDQHAYAIASMHDLDLVITASKPNERPTILYFYLCSLGASTPSEVMKSIVIPLMSDPISIIRDEAGKALKRWGEAQAAQKDSPAK